VGVDLSRRDLSMAGQFMNGVDAVDFFEEVRRESGEAYAARLPRGSRPGAPRRCERYPRSGAWAVLATLLCEIRVRAPARCRRELSHSLRMIPSPLLPSLRGS
jgi:hypothetical protein